MQQRDNSSPARCNLHWRDLYRGSGSGPCRDGTCSKPALLPHPACRKPSIQPTSKPTSKPTSQQAPSACRQETRSSRGGAAIPSGRWSQGSGTPGRHQRLGLRPSHPTAWVGVVGWLIAVWCCALLSSASVSESPSLVPCCWARLQYSRSKRRPLLRRLVSGSLPVPARPLGWMARGKSMRDDSSGFALFSSLTRLPRKTLLPR